MKFEAHVPSVNIVGVLRNIDSKNIFDVLSLYFSFSYGQNNASEFNISK